jgi:hypothetical protein
MVAQRIYGEIAAHRRSEFRTSRMTVRDEDAMHTGTSYGAIVSGALCWPGGLRWQVVYVTITHSS